MQNEHHTATTCYCSQADACLAWIEDRESEDLMRRAATCFITSALIGAVICSPAAAQWVPTKNVEVISAVAAGGAPDGTARIVQRIFSEKKLIPVSSVVVNRPGGQQTIAMNYLAQRPRDGH